MNSWNVPRISELLFSAGRIALRYFDAPPTEQKADNSIVTAADREIEAFLVDALTAGDPEVVVIGEETSHALAGGDIGAALTGTAWIVDPIDGTAQYARQLPYWGVSLALMQGGAVTNGALFLPLAGDLILTDGAGGVLHGRIPGDPEQWHNRELRRLSPAPESYRADGLVSVPQESYRPARFDGANPVEARGSAVYSAAGMALGRYLGYVSAVKLWDLAGAIPVLRALGLRIEFADGRPLDTTVTERDWVLDAEDPACWRCRGTLFVGGSSETIRVLRESYRGKR